MIAVFISLAASVAILPTVLAHGQVHNFITPLKTYPAADAYAAADPTSPLRKLNTYGPVPDFTTADVTCGPGGNTPVSVYANVNAGDTVTFDWGSWTSVHPGPVMTYIAECPNGCDTFKGDTGNVWVKVDQDQYNPTRNANYPWGEEIIRVANPSKYSVTIPTTLKAGQYILRHEILGLHVAGTVMGAQFYPNCVQIQVSGSGVETLPAGIPLPGSYDPYDTNGILIQLWQITPTQCNYTAPGGQVLYPFGTGALAGDWGAATYGGGPGTCPLSSGGSSTGGPTPIGPTSSPASSSIISTSTQVSSTSNSLSLSSSSTKSSTSSAPSSSSTAVAQKYGQCGGQGWTGPTVCAAGSSCTMSNQYYSQCL